MCGIQLTKSRCKEPCEVLYLGLKFKSHVQRFDIIFKCYIGIVALGLMWTNWSSIFGRFIYFVKTKIEVNSKFREFKKMIEMHTGKRIKIIRTDNGLEFCNNKVLKGLLMELYIKMFHIILSIRFLIALAVKLDLEICSSTIYFFGSMLIFFIVFCLCGKSLFLLILRNEKVLCLSLLYS